MRKPLLSAPTEQVLNLIAHVVMADAFAKNVGGSRAGSVDY
jgi:hypothetical protein